MAQAGSDILVRRNPKTSPSPLIFDSPHSGRNYPSDFMFSCPEAALRQAEDSYVDDLFSQAENNGAILIAAQFPRSYIDVNRAIDDIDPQLLSSTWPGPVKQSEKGRVGMGLVRRICKPGLPVYSRKLSVRDVQHRIETCYLPYHAELKSAIEQLSAKFGAVWHLNCHSMPSGAGRGPQEWGRADFVLGDRDGTTCDPEFTAVVNRILTGMDYSVRVNDPYKGVEIVRRYGNPARGVNSLQIEINRRLYLDEETMKPNRNYKRLKRDITSLISALRLYCEDQLYSAAAD
jgi:N-formylglutamate amidohydrolase